LAQSDLAEELKKPVRVGSLVPGFVLLGWVYLVYYLGGRPDYAGEFPFLVAAIGCIGGLCACAPPTGRPLLEKTRGVFMVTSILTAVVAIMARPVASTLIGSLAGAALGAGLGRFLHWRSKKGRI